MKISASSGERSWQSASFPGKRHAVERALAPDQFPCAPRGFSGTRRFNGLADDPLGKRWTFFQELPKPVVHERFDNAFHFAVAELGLRLTFELRIAEASR